MLKKYLSRILITLINGVLLIAGVFIIKSHEDNKKQDQTETSDASITESVSDNQSQETTPNNLPLSDSTASVVAPENSASDNKSVVTPAPSATSKLTTPAPKAVATPAPASKPKTKTKTS